MDISVQLRSKKGASRRKSLFALLLAIPLVSWAQNQTPSETNATVLFDSVTAQAKALAQQEYKAPVAVPPGLAELSFDQYRAIRFKKEKALWRGQALFEIQPLHPGFLYREPVNVHLIDRGGSRKELQFNPELFTYEAEGMPEPAALAAELGFAGFRVHYPLNTPSYKDEFLVFQGASYFRLIGPNQVYGLSARGLAVNTADSAGEEFPAFREFWLIQPDKNETKLTVIALLDSPSVSGVYRFDVYPGSPAHMDVQLKLFARQDITKLGVAPLTSMFHHGENGSRFVDDFRPEVHDSDGLLMATANNEWIWRPLSNPKALRIVSFQDENPAGFGLMQRDRDFEHYQDVGLEYHRRPGYWVQPTKPLGKGRVELVEIPTDSETNDNIVAYWVPAKAMKAGEEREFSYQLFSLNSAPAKHDLAKVIGSRVGRAHYHEGDSFSLSAKRQFVVDFSGLALANLSADMPVSATLQTSSGEYRELTVTKLPNGKDWRVAFKLYPDAEIPADMRLFLSWRGQRLSEVWNYVWYPESK
jgi:glucans biosynthesis protein